MDLNCYCYIFVQYHTGTNCDTGYDTFWSLISVTVFSMTCRKKLFYTIHLAAPSWGEFVFFGLIMCPLLHTLSLLFLLYWRISNNLSHLKNYVVKAVTVPYTDVLTKPSFLIYSQILQISTISQQTVNTILERHSAPYFREKKLDHYKADKYLRNLQLFIRQQRHISAKNHLYKGRLTAPSFSW